MMTEEEILRDVDNNYSDRKAIFVFLWQLRGGCPCGSTQYKESKSGRIRHCHGCGRTTSVTAGTLFESVRKIEAWFRCVALLVNGKELSCQAMAALTGVAPSTAWEMVQKIRLVLKEALESSCLVNWQALITLIARRTILTPERSHPRAEGNSRVSSMPVQPSATIERAVVSTTRLVRRMSQMVSLKYLQLYAAHGALINDQTPWSLPALLKKCLQTPPIHRQDILSYVSPDNIMLVQIPPASPS